MSENIKEIITIIFGSLFILLSVWNIFKSRGSRRDTTDSAGLREEQRRAAEEQHRIIEEQRRATEDEQLSLREQRKVINEQHELIREQQELIESQRKGTQRLREILDKAKDR